MAAFAQQQWLCNTLTENDEGGRTGTELMVDGMAGAGDNSEAGTNHE